VAAQADGGPDYEPTKEGKYGAYFLGKENKLLNYDSKDEDFVKLNTALWEMAEEDSQDSS